MSQLEDLVAAYRRIDRENMQDMGMRNPALTVEAVGFRDWNDGQLGVVITPWFINLIFVPSDGTASPPGSKVSRAFPSGTYEFRCDELDGFGPIQTCSLMSPVIEVDGLETARQIGAEIMTQIFAAPEPEPSQEAKFQKALSRRELLHGRRER